MYNASSRQHVLTQSSGTVWNFFHDEKLGLCYSTLTKRNSWTNPVSLYRNAFKSFYADIDEEDRFHLLFQDMQGNLLYGRLENEGINTVPVLNSKVPAVYDKFPFLIPFKNNIVFFYVLQHETSPFLACQVLNDGKLSAPRVIDYVTAGIPPCSIVYDKTGNIYAFYQSSDGKFLQLGYKKWNLAQKFWSEFTPITKYAGNCEFPRVIADGSDVLHICYQRQNQRQYELVYQQKVPDKNLWSNEVIVHSSAQTFENSAILGINEDILVYWVRDDILFYNTGSQSGSTWSKPAKYNFPAGRQLVCLHYGTNNLAEAGKIFVQDIPGCFIGGFKTAFYQPQPESPDHLSADDLKNLILESLKLLKAGVEDLKDGELNMRDEILRLKTTQQELEKELVKNNVKLGHLESSINQIKALNHRLEALSAELKSRREQADKVEPTGSE